MRNRQKNKKNDLLVNIAKCNDIKIAINDEKHPCHRIVSSQKLAYKEIQTPEPWAGNIKIVRILFISSNPSFNINDMVPRIRNGNNRKIRSFFNNRFDTHIRNGHHVIQKANGSIQKKSINYFSNIKNRAQEILGSSSIVPGKDYALTEIVHCKSVSEIGVDAAEDHCSNRYLCKILNLTKAPIICAVGPIARRQISLQYNKREKWSCFYKDKRLFIFLNHPSSSKPKKLSTMYANHISFIKRAIARTI